jgi:hypothetical protein
LISLKKSHRSVYEKWAPAFPVVYGGTVEEVAEREMEQEDALLGFWVVETRCGDSAERSRGNKLQPQKCPHASTVEALKLSKTKVNEMDDLFLDSVSSTSTVMS